MSSIRKICKVRKIFTRNKLTNKSFATKCRSKLTKWECRTLTFPKPVQNKSHQFKKFNPSKALTINLSNRLQKKKSAAKTVQSSMIMRMVAKSWNHSCKNFRKRSTKCQSLKQTMLTAEKCSMKRETSWERKRISVKNWPNNWKGSKVESVIVLSTQK